MINISTFFDFLKYCLGDKVDMSRVVAGMDWQLLYEFASKQALLGFCFDGIERLGKEFPEELKQNPMVLLSIVLMVAPMLLVTLRRIIVVALRVDNGLCVRVLSTLYIWMVSLVNHTNVSNIL